MIRSLLVVVLTSTLAFVAGIIASKKCPWTQKVFDSKPCACAIE